MLKSHPNMEATYEVVPLDGGLFGVKVSIPESSPTTVSSFETEDAVEAWIATHKARVQDEIHRAGFFAAVEPPSFERLPTGA